MKTLFVNTNLQACLIFSVCLLIYSCQEKIENVAFSPSEVIVQIKPDYSMEQVFEFVNNQENDVMEVQNAVYISAQPADSLSFILKILNEKPYTNDGTIHFTTGQSHYQSKQLMIYPVLYSINNLQFQQDWLKTVKLIGLTERPGAKLLQIRVPAGSEKDWVEIYKTNQFVKFAQLNLIQNVTQ